MEHGVLIDRELLNDIKGLLNLEQYTPLNTMLKEAIESAPEAVIILNKGYETGLLKALGAVVTKD